jgi:hypothetical protein
MVPALILIGGVSAVVLAYSFFSTTLATRYAKNHAVLNSASAERMSLDVKYDAGPLVEETYAMSDTDGLSKTSYKAVGRNGITVTVEERPRKTLEADANVAYLFGRVVQDGIWKLDTKPPRGNTAAHYRIDVYQLINGEHGSRFFEFTDPHYWATTAGHQFTIHLDKGKPIDESMIRMTSSIPAEPGYQALVADFETFGPASFRARVAAEKKRRFGLTS